MDATELVGGSVFAGYVIERRLGAGGMGTVYLARHRALDMPVALKLLTPRVTGTAGTATGRWAFSQPYAPPEQCAGRTVGPPADVHALAVTLYQLITGHLPREIPIPATDPSLPGLLGVVLSKATAWQPADRYSGCGALAAAAKAALRLPNSDQPPLSAVPNAPGHAAVLDTAPTESSPGRPESPPAQPLDTDLARLLAAADSAETVDARTRVSDAADDDPDGHWDGDGEPASPEAPGSAVSDGSRRSAWWRIAATGVVGAVAGAAVIAGVLRWNSDSDARPEATVPSAPITARCQYTATVPLAPDRPAIVPATADGGRRCVLSTKDAAQGTPSLVTAWRSWAVRTARLVSGP